MPAAAPATLKPSGTKHGNAAPVHAAVAAKSAPAAAPKHSAKGVVSARAAARVGLHLTTATAAAANQAGFGNLVATTSPGGLSRPWLTIDLIAHPAPFVPTAHGDSGVVIHTPAPPTAPPVRPAQPATQAGAAPTGTGGGIRQLTLAPRDMASPSSSPPTSVLVLHSPSGGDTTINCRAWIGLTGGHPDDPSVTWDDSATGIPDVVQGSSLSGGGGTQVTLVNEANGMVIPNFNLTSASWNLPSGMLKGYGTFGTSPLDPSDPSAGTYTTFNSGSDPGPTVHAMGFTASDLNYDSSNVKTTHVFSNAYFGHSSVGTVTISVNATFTATDGSGTTVSVTDSVKDYVLQPQGTISLVSQGSAGINNTAWFGAQSLSSSVLYDGTSSTPPGISLKGNVSTLAANAPRSLSGSFAFYQTVSTFASRKWTDGGGLKMEGTPLLPDGTSPGVVLDRAPYPGFLNSPYPTGQPSTGAPVGTDFYMEDTPSLGLLNSYVNGNYQSYYRSDYFETYLMFKPPGGGISIPVSVLNWEWNGTALWYAPTSNYVLWASNQHSDATSAPTTTYPEWDYSVSNFNWVAYT